MRAQFMAGAMLSFSGLLSDVIQSGVAGLTASNPGIVKVLGGFVFPVGLVMCVLFQFYHIVTPPSFLVPRPPSSIILVSGWSLVSRHDVHFYSNLFFVVFHSPAA